MSLADDLKKAPVKAEVDTVGTRRFNVKGLSLNGGAALMASCRRKNGMSDGDKFDRKLLEACVECEDGSTLTADEWGEVARCFTGPLVSVAMSCCGMDRDDFQRDPKDSDSIES